MFGMLSWNQKPLWADSCHIYLLGQMWEGSLAGFAGEVVTVQGCARLCGDLRGAAQCQGLSRPGGGPAA